MRSTHKQLLQSKQVALYTNAAQNRACETHHYYCSLKLGLVIFVLTTLFYNGVKIKEINQIKNEQITK